MDKVTFCNYIFIAVKHILLSMFTLYLHQLYAGLYAGTIDVNFPEHYTEGPDFKYKDPAFIDMDKTRPRRKNNLPGLTVMYTQGLLKERLKEVQSAEILEQDHQSLRLWEVW